MKKQNVIMIVLDTVRAKNLACYDYTTNTTPHLDDLCTSVNLFKNAFTPAIWTIPSHASIFTGTYPSKHGALNLSRFLNKKYTTLAELFTRNRYGTVAFSNNGFISLKEFGLSRGFDVIEGYDYPKSKLTKAIFKGWKMLRQAEDSGAFATNRFVSTWIRKGRNPQKPFFLFLNYMEAHAPHVHVPEKFLKMYLGRSERKVFKNINQDTQKYLTRMVETTESEFEILRSVYNAKLFYLDYMIHKLFTIFKRNGVWDKSIIIVTSDHGDLIGEHGLVHHSYSVHEELIRVPLIVKLPGKHDNGSTYDHLVSLVDIFPTLMELSGIKDDAVVEQLQGYNLFSNDPVKREHIFVECERPKNEFAETYPDFDFSVYDRQLLAIRSKKYKYIWASDGRHELFDLENDPSERKNLIEEMPLQADQMKTTLFNWYNSFEKAPSEGENKDAALNSEIKERLQALGYF